MSGKKARATPGILSKISAPLAERGINIDAVSTGEHAISFFVNEADADAAFRALSEAARKTALKDVSIRKGVGLVSVSGEELTRSGMFDRIVAPIAKAKINILQVTSSYDSLLLFFDFAESRRAYEILNKEIPKLLK